MKRLEPLLNIKELVVLDDTDFMSTNWAACKIAMSVIAYKVYKQARAC